jgi:peptidoglycan/xylan/chitin deacetylase (PgdA/CDA1 family)
MGTEALRTIELLSLEDMHGRYAMKLGVGGDSGRADVATELETELDEATFMHLRKLDPISEGRARLSLYAKYDPFRKTYFSSIVKLNKAGSQSYYFDCSAEFEAMLGRIRNGEMLEAERTEEPVAVAVDVTAGGMGSPMVELTWSFAALTGTAIRARMSRYALSALRLLVLSILFLLIWFEVEGQLHIDNAKALSEDQIVVAEGSGEGAKQGATLVQTAGLTEGVVDRPPQASDSGKDTMKEDGGEAALALASPSSSVANSAKAETVAGADVDTGENQALADGLDEKLVELITLDGEAPLYSLPDGYVALTFDDGPSDYTKAIVDLLKERGVAGTFLFVGRNVDHYPEEAAYAAGQGMAVGNHSWDHSKLTKFEIDAISANIDKANQAIGKRSASPVSVFRPPYGATNDDVEIATEELGMKMLMWNRDPEDWKADTSDDIVRYFKQLSASGGIYVMHEKKATLDALPDIIDYLLGQKLKFAVFQ